MSGKNIKKILILASNPTDTSRLRLDQEVRDIQAGLERSRHRDQFEIVARWATRPADLRRALLDHQPQIVHFAGHGSGSQGLVLENNSGQPQIVSSEALAGLFRLSDQVKCVVLNACYSEPQAQAIHQHIDYVIGMNQAIGDRAAIEFAVGFYDALGAGRSVEDAFEFGRNAIELEGIAEGLTPVLKKDAGLLAETLPIRQGTPVSTTQVSHERNPEAKWVLVLEGNLDKDLSKEKLDKLVEHLRNLSGDASLKIEGIKSGSIILKLDSSEEAFKVIESLYKEGKLTEILGLPLKYVGYELPTSKTNNTNTIDVFFSYCHKDEDLRNELATHLSILERDGVISGWCDRQIIAGEEWADQIDERMDAANVILLLISSDFIASNYCWNIEVKRAMERHEAGSACVVPVILRPVNWRRAPFGKLQALPKDAKPVTTWSNRDEAFLNISQSIEAVVNRFSNR